MVELKVDKLKAIGYLDKVLITGLHRPLHPSIGIELTGKDIGTCLESEYSGMSQHFSRVTVQILGESTTALGGSPLNYGQARLGLRKYYDRDALISKKSPNTKVIQEVFVICTADLIVFDGNVIALEEEPNWIDSVAKESDDTNSILAAVELSRYIQVRNNTFAAGTVMVDKVYTDKVFRHCGVSTWLHDNLKHIVEYLCNLQVDGAILVAGDYTHESEVMFNMTPLDYIEMLTSHYSDCGYSKAEQVIPKFSGINTSNMLYRLFK